MRGLEEHEQVSELFRTLGSPVRVALVSLLADGELCVHELVDALELPQPLVSQHLRVLREADLVTQDPARPGGGLRAARRPRRAHRP